MKKNTLEARRKYRENLRSIYEESETKEELHNEVIIGEPIPSLEREELEDLTKEELIVRARKMGLAVAKNYARETLIKKIMEV